MTRDYDVIIIGAGNGGLVSACAFSQMGFRTLVVERNSTPGGCASSFVRGRFEFEAALHNLPYMGEGEARGDVGMLYDRFGVERKFFPITESLHFIVDKGTRREFISGVGRDAFAEAVEKECPGSEPSFRRFCSLCDELNAAVGYMSSCRGKPDQQVLQQQFPNYLRMASSSVKQMFDALEMPQELQDILGVFAMYQCGDVNEIDAARYSLMTDSFIKYGAFQTDMRSFGLSTALAESAVKFGCDFWYNSPVAEILTENGAVSGVRLEDGTEAHAKQVVCNIMPHTVYGKLLKSELVPPLELKKANARTLGGRPFCVYLGLDATAEELGIKDYAVFINSSTDNPTLVKNCASRDTTDDFSANCLNIPVPDASPEGTCILYFTNMFSEDAFADVTPDNYRKIKHDYAKRLIERYESATGIEISSHIEEIVIATPVTFARYVGTPQGTVFGYYPGDWDGMMSRTMAEETEKTIPGLSFVGGHGTRLSGFAPSYMTGFLNAMKLGAMMRGGAPRG